MKPELYFLPKVIYCLPLPVRAYAHHQQQEQNGIVQR
jgi:hypothetical protein